MTETVSATRLSHILGVTVRRLNQLAEDGVLSRSAAGFDLDASVRAYCAYLKKDEATRIERRKLLQAQTLATAVRAKKATAELMTRAEVRRRLGPGIDALWLARTPAYSMFAKLDPIVGKDRSQVIAHECYSEMSAYIAQARDKLLAPFAEPKATDLDDDLRRLGVELPDDGDGEDDVH